MIYTILPSVAHVNTRFADVRGKVRPAVLTYDDIRRRPRFQLHQKCPPIRSSSPSKKDRADAHHRSALSLGFSVMVL